MPHKSHTFYNNNNNNNNNNNCQSLTYQYLSVFYYVLHGLVACALTSRLVD